jgi:hypothetical protein
VQRGEYELSVALRRLYRDNVHRHGGHARFADWAEHEFGIPGKLADLFCFIGRHLERLPKTRDALERGELGYTKVREFVKLATKDDESRWIEFATTHTNRELEREVLRARGGTAAEETKVVTRLSPEQVQTTRKAREKMMKVVGCSVPADQLLPKLAEAFVESPGLFAAATDSDESTATPASKSTPYLTINFCCECSTTYVPVPGENLRVPFEDWVTALADGAEVHDIVADFLCDCDGEGVRHRRDRCPHGARRDPAAATEPSSRHIPAAVRRHVEARDGHRCRRPGCGNPVAMEMSHLKPFRDGTPPTAEFLAQHCATCNDLIETGRLRVEGEAPLEQYWLAGAGEPMAAEYLGYGFDPAPHVGKPGSSAREGGAAPIGAPIGAS